MKLRLHYTIVILLLVILFTGSSVKAQIASNERDRGIELYRQNDLQKAADVLQAVVAADKKNRLAWIYLSLSYGKLGKADKAIKYMRKAADISLKDSSGSQFYDQEAKIISSPRPRYTQAAKRSMTTGRVKLAIELGANGKVLFIVPVYGLPDGLTEECAAAALNIKFDPALRNGNPVSSVKILEYSFDVF